MSRRLQEGQRNETPSTSHPPGPAAQGVLLFTKAQMAAAMQVSLRCLTGMMNRGEISYLKINGRIVRSRPEDALRRLNEKTLVCNDTTAEGGA